MEVKAWPLETDGDIVYIMCRQADTRLTNEVPFIFAGVELDMTVTPHTTLIDCSNPMLTQI